MKKGGKITTDKILMGTRLCINITVKLLKPGIKAQLSNMKLNFVEALQKMFRTTFGVELYFTGVNDTEKIMLNNCLLEQRMEKGLQ